MPLRKKNLYLSLYICPECVYFIISVGLIFKNKHASIGEIKLTMGLNPSFEHFSYIIIWFKALSKSRSVFHSGLRVSI